MKIEIDHSIRAYDGARLTWTIEDLRHQLSYTIAQYNEAHKAWQDAGSTDDFLAKLKERNMWWDARKHAKKQLDEAMYAA